MVVVGGLRGEFEAKNTAIHLGSFSSVDAS